jgi:hypothetical protein
LTAFLAFVEEGFDSGFDNVGHGISDVNFVEPVGVSFCEFGKGVGGIAR